MEEFFEFAELLCNRVNVNTSNGETVPMFTIQLRVFPTRVGVQTPPESLPVVHVSPRQFPELLAAIQMAMERYFPGPASGSSPSSPGSSGSTPTVQ